MSEDYSRFFFGLTNGDKNDKNCWYEYSVYDSDLTKTESNTMDCDNNLIISFDQVRFNKKGDMACLVKKKLYSAPIDYRSPVVNKTSKITYELKVIRDNAEWNYTLLMLKQLIVDSKITFMENGAAAITGFYSPTSENMGIGTFFIKENMAEKEIGRTYFSQFSDLENAKITSTKIEYGETKNRTEHYNFYIDGIVSTNNSIYLIAQQGWSKGYYKSAISKIPEKIRYAPNILTDIIIVKYDVDGHVIWRKFLPKKHDFSKGYGAWSSLAFNYDFDTENLYLIYNDHSKNIDIEDCTAIKSTPWGKNSMVRVVKNIDSNGFVKTGLLDLSEYNYFMSTMISWSDKLRNSNSILLRMEGKVSFTFGEVSFSN